jgi:predicted DsbA family dithiol-disulfide isomerase
MKMKVEIWSDVVCPFCYIGKRKFEAGMEGFAHKDEIEVIWKSYQLNPDAKHVPGKDIFQTLADMKGQSLDWSKQMHENVAQMARVVGLDYRFDRVKPANTFEAHRVIQLAKKRDLADKMEERLFRAYFTDGELISDPDTLIRLAGEAGLDRDEVANMLEGERYIDAVERDIEEAARLGVRGVPFFVLNRKYAVSGAQDPSVFLQTLNAAYDEWKKAQPAADLKADNGPSCPTEGDCD